MTPVEKSFTNLVGEVERVASFTLRELCETGVAVEIFLVPDKVVQSLNRKYRGKSTPTDILSFEILRDGTMPRPDMKGTRFLGELFIAPRWASKKKNDVRFLVIHGILHLFGYTHESEKKSIIMGKQEQQIWNRYVKNFNQS